MPKSFFLIKIKKYLISQSGTLLVEKMSYFTYNHHYVEDIIVQFNGWYILLKSIKSFVLR
jgi:hypothetical protein